MSIAGGLKRAPEAAHSMGCGAFQMFASNSRSWKPRQISDSEADEFIEAKKGLASFVHLPYLCNPSSPNSNVSAHSLSTIRSTLDACNKLRIDAAVLHIGSHLGSGMEKGIESASEMVGSAYDSSSHTRLLLENSAGYKNSVGSKLEEIKAIIDMSGSGAGVCIDTCHAFAAGYELRSAEGARSFAKSIRANFGGIGLIHLNDAKYGLGSGLDRHEHIGKGTIGEEGFTNLLAQPEFAAGSAIIEVPGGETILKNDLAVIERILSKHGAALKGPD